VAQDRLVLFLVLQIALQVALHHSMRLADRAHTLAFTAHLGTGVARRQARFKKSRRITRTEGMLACTGHVVQALVVKHANRAGRRELAFTTATGAHTRRAFSAFFQPTPNRRIRVGIVAAVFFLALVSVAAVALLATLHNAVAAQRAVVLLEAELYRILHKRVNDRAHLVLAALREIPVVAISAGRGTPVHDIIAALVSTRRALRIVRIVFRAEIVADLVRERYL